jgi:hydrogenase nickel incorporation protein HypB
MFASATIVALAKIDLLPYVPFDAARARRDLAEICPRARVVELSARTGTGLDAWRGWLRDSAATATRVAP